MKKSLKRFLPFVIVLALCMSLFTVSAFAVDKRNPTVQKTEDGKAWEAVDKDGKVIRNGWVATNPEDEPKNQTWYYASKGTLVTGWHKIDGDWYYFDPDNAFMYSGSSKYGPAYIYDGKEPENSQQWRDAKDEWWFNADGSLYSGPSGWMSVMGTTNDGTPHRYWFYVNSDGSIYKGWVEDDGKDYSVEPVMAEGPRLSSYPGEYKDREYLGTTWEEAPHYFVNKDGSFVQNGWASEPWFYTDEETGESYSGRTWYYAGDNGVLVNGWNQIDGKWYFFGSTDPDRPNENWMNQNTFIQIGDNWYRLDKSGARVEGWESFKTEGADADGNAVTGREWMYFEPGTGVMVENGWKKIDGKWYIFSDSIMQHDTAVVDEETGKEYYLGADGAMVTGWVQDSQGEWYNYGDDGALVTDSWIEDANGSWYYVDANGEMARDADIDGYYVGTDGAWIPD